MGITAKESGGKDFDPIDEGIHKAIAYSLWDLGHQENKTFNKVSHEVMITWELTDERIELEKDGESVNLPRAISRRYTLSLHKLSNLRKDLQTWRGKGFSDEELTGFDLISILGVSCQLQILHTKKDDKVYANIFAILPGEGKKDTENPLAYFSFEEHTKIPESCPDWIADKIRESTEWAELMAGEMSDHNQEEPAFKEGEEPF